MSSTRPWPPTFTASEIEAVFDEADQGQWSGRLDWMLRFISDDGARMLEWEPRVRALLSNTNAMIVAHAITVLASRWNLPEFRAECRTFADHPDQEVRVQALFGLERYGFRTGDYELASFFFDILNDTSRPNRERRRAVSAIPRIVEGNLPEMVPFNNALDAIVGTDADFDELVPWDWLNEFMEKHRPRNEPD